MRKNILHKTIFFDSFLIYYMDSSFGFVDASCFEIHFVAPPFGLK